jgi:hypothetical protein
MLALMIGGRSRENLSAESLHLTATHAESVAPLTAKDCSASFSAALRVMTHGLLSSLLDEGAHVIAAMQTSNIEALADGRSLSSMLLRQSRHVPDLNRARPSTINFHEYRGLPYTD